MNIAITKKLAEAYKIKIEKPDLEEVSIFNWHANIFYFERKKCIHFMNDRSRFSMILFSVAMADMRNIEQIFKESFEETMMANGTDLKAINHYIENCGEISFSKTFNRSILGSMNEDIYFITWDMAEHLDFDQMNQVYVNLSDHKNIFQEDGKIYRGIELMSDQIEEMYQKSRKI